MNTIIEDFKHNTTKWMTALFLFIKPLSDMWYQNRWLDGILLVYVCILVIKQRKEIQWTKELSVLLLTVCYFTISYTIDAPIGNVVSIIKVVSIAFIVLLAHTSKMGDIYDYLVIVKWSYCLVLVVNYVYLFAGLGFKQWPPDRVTYSVVFSGPYYFKTDLAIAMTQAIIVFLLGQSLSIIDLLASGLALLLIVISNSRSLLGVALLIIALFLLKKVFREKIRLRYFFICAFVLLIFSILGLRLIARIPLLEKYQFIAFKSIKEIEEIGYGTGIEGFLLYNTNYRSLIWIEHIKYMWNDGLLHRLFGHGGCLHNTDLFSGDPHSMYVWSLASGGLIGACLLLICIALSFRQLTLIENKHIYYLAMALMALFLIVGFSVTTTLHTQSVWIPFFICSLAYRRGEQKAGFRESV